MRILSYSLSLALLTLAFGCGEPPAPVGPAAEAMIDDIEITMDEPVVAETSETSAGE